MKIFKKRIWILIIALSGFLWTKAFQAYGNYEVDISTTDPEELKLLIMEYASCMDSPELYFSNRPDCVKLRQILDNEYTQTLIARNELSFEDGRKTEMFNRRLSAWIYRDYMGGVDVHNTPQFIMIDQYCKRMERSGIMLLRCKMFNYVKER